MVAWLLLALLAACGGDKKSTTPVEVAITISPTSASLAGGQTQQFTGTVTGSTNTAVTWRVQGVEGGNATVGTITTAGLYTAPPLVPSVNPVVVTAVAQADTTKIANASVTITSSVMITVSPSSVTLLAGAQQTFTAKIGDNAITPVWTLSCGSTAAGACGGITAAGVYTAPPAPPPGGSVTVRAATSDNSATPANATVTVQFANASLSGSYAFSFAGLAAGRYFAETGSIAFDGKGNITGGVEDSALPPAMLNAAIVGGSYSVGADGRGSASVQIGSTSNVVNWQFVLAGHSRGVAMRFDGAGATAGGTLDLQDPAQFTGAALTGGYVLAASGATGGGARAALVAGIAADGAGNISQGTLDMNAGGTVTSAGALTGTYTAPSSEGRGTLTFNSGSGPLSFSYYIVDGARVKLIETDGLRFTTGQLTRMASGAQSNSSLRGDYAFTYAGSGAQGAFAAGGVFTADGFGSITGGTEDLSGATVQAGLGLTGSYLVSNPTTGRATVSLTVNGAASSFVFYPRSDGAWDFIRTDSGGVAQGTAFLQPLSTFSAATLSGVYAVNLTGTAVPAGQLDLVGLFTLRGGSAFSGTAAINENGITAAGVPLTAGAFAVQPNGRGTATFTAGPASLNGSSVFLYIVDSRTALLLVAGNGRTLTGSLQFAF